MDGFKLPSMWHSIQSFSSHYLSTDRWAMVRPLVVKSVDQGRDSSLNESMQSCGGWYGRKEVEEVEFADRLFLAEFRTWEK